MITIFNVQTLFSLIASLAVALGTNVNAPTEQVSIDGNETQVESFTEVTDQNQGSDIVPEIEMNNMFDPKVEKQINAEIQAEKEKQEASGESNTTITSTQETTIEKETRDAQDAADAQEEPKSTESENQAEPNEIEVDSSSNVNINKVLKKIDVDLDF